VDEFPQAAALEALAVSGRRPDGDDVIRVFWRGREASGERWGGGGGRRGGREKRRRGKGEKRRKKRRRRGKG